MSDPIKALPGPLKSVEFMSKSLITLDAEDTMRHAACVLLDKNISGAPVLNDKDQPIGVLTKTDIVRYEREHVAVSSAEIDRDVMRTLGTLEAVCQIKSHHRESEEDYVSHWMTPKVFAVNEETPLAEVVKELTERRIHRLFVREKKTQKLTGVITTFDLLKILSKLL